MTGLHLHSDLIKLRALEPEDLELLYHWENDSSLWQFGSTIQPLSQHQLRTYIASAGEQQVMQSGQLRLMIELLTLGETIGSIDLYDLDAFHGRAGVGILIDSRHQNKGYGKATLELIKRYSFDFLGLNQLYVHIPVSNTASLKLFAHAGFEESGRLRCWNKTSFRSYEDVLVLQCINLKAIGF